MMTLKELMKQRAKPGMVIISDVDGVHTSPKGGAKISAEPSKKFGTLFTLRDGNRVLELQAVGDSKDQTEFVIGGFGDEDIMEFYQFHTPDGQAILTLREHGVDIVIVSGRNAAPVRDRFEGKLGAKTYLGVRNKLDWFHAEGFVLQNTIFISDGHQDAPLLQAVHDAGGIAVATADAEFEAKEASGAITQAKGGEGAFAESAYTYLDFLKVK